jgi:hypothetical protein
MKTRFIAGLAVVVVSAAACRDANAPSSQLAISMASVYSVTPAGFDRLSTSFNADPGAGAFQPEFDGHGHGFGGFGPHGGGPGFGLGLMGGGLGGPFLGDGLGPMHDHDGSCTFSSSTGLVTCTDTAHGLTVTRLSKITTAAGTAQDKPDSTTNTIASTVTVSGTVTRRDSSTSVVSESSTQTVTGLAKGSSQRTMNGASAGTETTTGKSAQGAFTAKRAAGDTITGVVVPAPTAGTRTYPTAGTVIRNMNVTVTISGQTPATTSRREVITYDGSATAKVVITHDGTTQNCTLPLPHGHLTCQ